MSSPEAPVPFSPAWYAQPVAISRYDRVMGPVMNGVIGALEAVATIGRKA